MTITLFLTGLVRQPDTLARNIRKLKTGFKAENTICTFWDYRDVQDIPTSNSLKLDTKIDSHTISKLLMEQKVSTEFFTPSELVFQKKYEHPMEKQLQLNPNPNATSSWMRALRNASISGSNHGKKEGFFLILRPDLKTSRYLNFVARITIKKILEEEKCILVATRPYPHRVLKVGNKGFNLPIDHFFIGQMKEVGLFTDLVSFFENALEGVDTRQPLVNEFLIGQYLLDKEFKIFEFPLPYLIQRKNFVESITPFGQVGFSLQIQRVRNLSFLLKQAVSLHLLLFRPNMVYKWQI